MSIQSYYNRQIANIIISYVNDPSDPKQKKLGSDEKEIIAGQFDARIDTSHLEFEINKEFECPLTLEYFTEAAITPCGHTFDAHFLYQSLEHNPQCSFDRNPINAQNLRPNHLVTKVTSQVRDLLVKREKEKLIKVALKLDNVGKYNIDGYVLDCITHCLLTEAVSLPCGHKYNFTPIMRWYESNNHDNHSRCPLDNVPFTLKSLSLDTKTSKKAKKLLKSIKQFNEKIVVNNLKRFKSFDARYQRDQEIVKIIQNLYKCPISKKSLSNPVVSACGHTFERTSVKIDSVCPYDQSKIRDLIPNYLVKNHLEIICHFDPMRYFEIIPARKAEDAPLTSDADEAGFIFHARPTMKAIELENFLLDLGLRSKRRKDGDPWIKHSGVKVYFNSLHFNLRHFMESRFLPRGFWNRDNISIKVTNDIYIQQYQEKSDEKMDFNND